MRHKTMISSYFVLYIKILLQVKAIPTSSIANTNIFPKELNVSKRIIMFLDQKGK